MQRLRKALRILLRPALLVAALVVLCATIFVLDCKPQPLALPVTPASHRAPPEAAAVANYARDEVDTFYTYPEWYIIWSYQAKADFQQQHLPSGFTYMRRHRPVLGSRLPRLCADPACLHVCNAAGAHVNQIAGKENISASVLAPNVWRNLIPGTQTLLTHPVSCQLQVTRVLILLPISQLPSIVQALPSQAVHSNISTTSRRAQKRLPALPR